MDQHASTSKSAQDQDAFDLEGEDSTVGDEEKLERLGELEGLPESVSARDKFGANPRPQMESRGKVNMKHDIHGTPAENLQQLIRDCGVSPHKVRNVTQGRAFDYLADHQLAELVHELPPKHFADKIIDWFFSKLNFARYPLDERHFRQCESISAVQVRRN